MLSVHGNRTVITSGINVNVLAAVRLCVRVADGPLSLYIACIWSGPLHSTIYRVYGLGCQS